MTDPDDEYDIDKLIATLNAPTAPGNEVEDSYLPTSRENALPTDLTTSREPNSTLVRMYPSRSGRASKYPWDVWLDGRVHVATRGHDFDQPRSRFVVFLHNRANVLDRFVVTRYLSTHSVEAVEFRFCRTKEDRDGQKELWRIEEEQYRNQYANVPLE